MKPRVISIGENPKRIVSTIQGMRFIPLSERIFLESDSVYSILNLKGGERMTILNSFKMLEELCCHSGMFRLHKKYIVSMQQIKYYVKTDGGHVILLNGRQLPVSRMKKEQFQKKLGVI